MIICDLVTLIFKKMWLYMQYFTHSLKKRHISPIFLLFLKSKLRFSEALSLGYWTHLAYLTIIIIKHLDSSPFSVWSWIIVWFLKNCFSPVKNLTEILAAKICHKHSQFLCILVMDKEK